MKYLDANVLIHAAAPQEPRKHQLSVALLERVRRSQQQIFITDLVLAEVAAVLTTARSGRFSHMQIRQFLEPILSWPAVHVVDKGIWPRAFEIFVQHGVDLPDAHQIALLERDGEGEILTFDSRLGRIPGVRTTEPAANVSDA